MVSRFHEQDFVNPRIAYYKYTGIHQFTNKFFQLLRFHNEKCQILLERRWGLVKEKSEAHLHNNWVLSLKTAKMHLYFIIIKKK